MGTQLTLASVAVAKEIDGIEMGVLSDGTPYLTGRALAKVCNLAPSAIIMQGQRWKDGHRDGKLATWLMQNGVEVNRDSLYIETAQGGTRVTAYPDDVAALILEYYALYADRDDAAVRARFRKLTSHGLRMYVYSALGYEPSRAVPDVWRQHHDRLLLVTAPAGYFSVFKEIDELVLTAIRAGLKADDHTVPDISVGIAWGKHWDENGFDARFGERIRHDHNYPDYFPQATSNPQEIWVYPLDALIEFRKWLQAVYVTTKLPAYLNRKVSDGRLPAGAAKALLLEAKAPAPPTLHR